MKIKVIVFCLCYMCFSLSSCDEDDVSSLLPSFDVDLNKTVSIPVQVDQTTGDWVTFSEKTNLNIVTKDTEDYLNKIKEVKINNLSYKIINFNGDPNGEVNGSFSVANQVSLQNAFVVQTAAQNQTQYQVTETKELSRIANALKSGQSVAVEYSGSALCNDDAMDFIVEVSLVGKVTIDP